MNVLHAKFDDYPNEKMDYVTSRKKIYVPEYFNLVKNREMVNYWKKLVNDEKTVVVYDFDGPRNDNGTVKCIRVTKELLKEKINDTKFPFGHGYIVAGLLLGYVPSDYIQ